MTIPNRISLLLVAGFLVIAPVTGMGWEKISIHIGVAAAALVCGFVLFSFGFVGGGDAKLLAAAVLWIGLDDLSAYIYAAVLFGAGLSIFILLYRNILPPRWMLGQPWAMRLHDKKEGVPYGIALALGVLWVFPSTSWFLAVGV